MRIDELKLSDYKQLSALEESNAIAKWLGSKGCKLIGVGAYAKAYSIPDDPTKIIKVSYKEDKEWLKFLEVAEKFPSIHYPKIRKTKVFNGHYYIALVEILTPFSKTPDALKKDLGDFMYRYLDRFSIPGKSFWEEYEGVGNIKRFEENYPTFSKALNNLVQYGRRNIDLHDANIMFRGKCPVINDPYSGL